jgi:hypothetical protein
MNFYFIIENENHDFKIPSFNFTWIKKIYQLKVVITNIIIDKLNVSIAKNYTSSQ